MNLRQVEYSVVDHENLIIIDARIGRVLLGRVKCTRDAERLLVGDIMVEEKMPQIRQTAWQRILSFVPSRFTQRLRRRGIGTELLRRVLEMADSAGIEKVWGCITQDDLQAQPFLLKWYERHGFVIQEPDHECLAGTARKIVRFAWKTQDDDSRNP